MHPTLLIVTSLPAQVTGICLHFYIKNTATETSFKYTQAFSQGFSEDIPFSFILFYSLFSPFFPSVMDYFFIV